MTETPPDRSAMSVFMASLPDGSGLTITCYCGAGLAGPEQHGPDCTAHVTPPVDAEETIRP